MSNRSRKVHPIEPNYEVMIGPTAKRSRSDMELDDVPHEAAPWKRAIAGMCL